MKTRKAILGSLFIFFAISSFAAKIPKMSIVPLESQKAVVEFQSFSPTLFELTVKDSHGEILMYKKSEKPLDNYSTVFDFSQLDDGTYNFLLNFGNCSLDRNVIVSNSTVNISDEVRNCKPYFQFDEGQLKVSFFNKQQHKIYLNVYENGQYISGAKLGKDLCLQKSVDLSKLKKGNYEIVLSDLENDYQFTVSK